MTQSGMLASIVSHQQAQRSLRGQATWPVTMARRARQPSPAGPRHVGQLARAVDEAEEGGVLFFFEMRR